MDEQYMRVALHLAQVCQGQTSPNPTVGSVIVRNHEVVGFGAHLRAGEAHAEVHALSMAGEKARGATMYVTLEPCSHYGRTPPCVARIVESGVARVVVATLDPDERVAGRGIDALRAASIHVDVGVLEKEARQMNETYMFAKAHKRPFVTLKSASTLDGKIATASGESKWITSSQARKDTHVLRHRHDAILVGIGTVLSDDPQLTTRLSDGEGRSPVRVVLDSRLRIPENVRLIDTAKVPTWIFCTDAVDTQKVERLRGQGVRVFPIQMEEGKHGHVPIEHVLRVLFDQNITSVLVEGGGKVNASFLSGRFVNKLIMYVAPKLVGGQHAPGFFSGAGIPSLDQAVQLANVQYEHVGPDLKITADIKTT